MGCCWAAFLDAVVDCTCKRGQQGPPESKGYEMAGTWFDRKRGNDAYWAVTGKGRNGHSNKRPQEYARDERDYYGDEDDR